MAMFRTLTAREIECRVAQIGKRGDGLNLLLYKDARCDQNILDETVGPMGWQRHHTRDNANCTVSLWDKDKAQWISKEDTGTESNTEAEKGLASDSFKRACFNWGIGRELYSAPFIWIRKGEDCKITEQNGRFKCADRYEVAEIGYNDHREISRLKIVNEKTRNVVFDWRAGEGTAEAARAAGERRLAELEAKAAQLASEEQKAELRGLVNLEQLESCTKMYGDNWERMTAYQAMALIRKLGREHEGATG